jgi:tetratricopeptide (TPR) repeat protein
VEVTNEPPPSTPGHAELVRNTWRRIDWLSHYELLGVPREATEEEIRRAYLEKGRLFHPDLRHRPDLAAFERELTAVFERLKVAYEILGDPAKRAEYDQASDEPEARVFAEEAVVDVEARRQLAAKNYTYAMKLIDAKDYFPAVELLQEAARFAPDKPEYRFRLGEVELKNAKWVERGLENLKEATRLAPDRADFQRDTARALLSNGRRREAEPYARRACEIEPGAESNALLQEITGRATQEPAPPPSETRGGFLSRLLKKGR